MIMKHFNLKSVSVKNWLLENPNVSGAVKENPLFYYPFKSISEIWNTELVSNNYKPLLKRVLSFFKLAWKCLSPPFYRTLAIVRLGVRIKQFFVCFLQKNHKRFYGVGKWFFGFRSRFEFEVKTNKLNLLRLDKSWSHNDAEMLLKSFWTSHLKMMNGLEPLFYNWTGRRKGIPKGVNETHPWLFHSGQYWSTFT